MAETNLQGHFAASSMGQESVEAVYKPAGMFSKTLSPTAVDVSIL